MKGLGLFVAFLGGAALGAAAGLLLAPEKGADTRKRIVDEGNRLADKLNDKLRSKGVKLSREDVADMVDDLADELKPILD